MEKKFIINLNEIGAYEKIGRVINMFTEEEIRRYYYFLKEFKHNSFKGIIYKAN